RAATAWLRSRPGAKAWLAVFTALNSDAVDDELRAAAQPWLRRSAEHPAWWWVFVQSVIPEDASPRVMGAARVWQRKHPGSCGIGPVTDVLANNDRLAGARPQADAERTVTE